VRIEINSIGLGGVATISGFQNDFSGLISKSRKMIAAFQVVKQQSYGMNGGIGNLQSAVDKVENRISVEENRITAIENVEKKADNFLELAIKTDIQAGAQVNKNKNEFYRVNPWAKPPPPPKEKNYLQKAGEWLCKKGEQIVDGVRSIKDAVVNFGKSVAETISKAWKSTVEWYKKNKDFINQVFCEVLVGALVIGLALATGGTSLAVTVAVAAGTGAALGGVGGAIEHYMEYGTTEGMVKSIVGGAAKGFMTGSITGIVGGHVTLAAKSMNLGRCATTAFGAVTDGMASAGAEYIHAVTDGNGITEEEKREIIKSGITDTVLGGIDHYKGFEKVGNDIIGKETNLEKLMHNEKYLKDTKQSIMTTAVKNMKNGLPGSIYNAQEAIRDLTAFNKYLMKNIIKDEAIDNLRDGVRDLIVDNSLKAFGI